MSTISRQTAANNSTFQESQGNFTYTLAQFGRKTHSFLWGLQWKNEILKEFIWPGGHRETHSKQIRRETEQEEKWSSSATWEKNLHFLLFVSCMARFQALRSSVSLTVRYPGLWHYQSRSFLLVVLFPKDLEKAAHFTGKGSTPYFKAFRCSVRVIKLCQTKSTLVEILSGIIL